MVTESDSPCTTERLVSVTLERSIKRQGQWEYPVWQVLQVRDADHDESEASTESSTSQAERFTWERLPIVLHKDAAEGYWYNLSGDVPSLFVVCCDDDEEEEAEDPQLMPVRVTLNHDEAAAHLETDDTVLSVAMPESLREWLTAFVETHYKPEKRKKRKRTEWDEDQHEAEKPRAQRPVRGA